METKFNFNSQVCTDKEQSERLLTLGLKNETADMHHWESEGKLYTYVGQMGDPNGIPAWSLHRLIEMIDEECVVHLDNFTITGRIFDVYDNLYDNIVSCIEWLIKRGYFSKEYLN